MATKQVRYVGPYDEVTVPDAGVTVKRGETVEVDGDVAKSLTAQSVWEAVAERKSGDGKTKDGA